MTSVQQDFSGGINAFRDETKLADNECVFAKNVRSRTGALEGIEEPIEYPIDAEHTFADEILDAEVDFVNYNVYILRLVSWKSYVFAVVLFTDKATDKIGHVIIFRFESASTGMWSVVRMISTSTAIPSYLSEINVTGTDGSLTRTITDCYTVELPASSEFVKRTAAGADPYAAITYGAIETGDRSEDGLLIVWNQPVIYGATTLNATVAVMMIEFDAFIQINTLQLWWSQTNRQYIPYSGCKGLAYADGILYWVGYNGTDIYRSVQGRPLDFVVNIDTSGEPGEADKVEVTTAYSVSANEITCIRALTTGQIFVGTRYDSYFIEPNYTDLIFGEVTFNKSPAFKTGVINKDSMTELPTDLALIVPESGIRSFNAVSQNKMRGRNSVFSLKIDKLLDGVTQTALTDDPSLPSNWYLHPCCLVYDNYALFSVKTTEGNAVMVYDTLTESWTSLDNYFDSSTIQIRNFAVRDRTTSFELWCQTGSTVYHLFGATIKFNCELRPRALSTQVPSVKGKHQYAFMVFQGGTDQTEITWVEYVDGKRGRTLKQKLQITNSGIPYPVTYPVTFSERRTLNDIKFNAEGLGNRGWKFQSRIYWPGDAKLLYYQVNVADISGDVGPLQQNAAYRE